MTLIISLSNLKAFSILRVLKSERWELELKPWHCQLGAMGSLFLSSQHYILEALGLILGSGVIMVTKVA